MQGKSKYVLEERPESDVFVTDSGHIGIRQIVRGEQSMVIFTPDEAEKIIGYIRKCLEQVRKENVN